MQFNEYLHKKYNFEVEDDEIELIKNRLRSSIYYSANIYIAGNGGSAYSGSHFAQDLIKVCSGKAISLTDNVGLMLAVANDISFDQIFKFQLSKLSKSDMDCALFIAISCSGNSRNILEATSYANDQGMLTISFTGYNGGRLKKISDYNVNIESDNIYVIESYHSMLFHHFVDELKPC